MLLWVNIVILNVCYYDLILLYYVIMIQYCYTKCMLLWVNIVILNVCYYELILLY